MDVEAKWPEKQNQYWDKLSQMKAENIKSLDKAILTLSSSALAFTVCLAFQQKNGSWQEPKLLMITWCFFLSAIVTQILGYIFGNASIDRFVKIVAEDFEATVKRINEGRLTKGKCAAISSALNYISPASLIAGLIVFVFFCSRNI